MLLADHDQVHLEPRDLVASVVYTCEKGHENELMEFEQTKQRTYPNFKVDFDLCAASIIGEVDSAAAKLRDTLSITGFKSMSSTVFNAAQTKLNEGGRKILQAGQRIDRSKD